MTNILTQVRDVQTLLAIYDRSCRACIDEAMVKDGDAFKFAAADLIRAPELLALGEEVEMLRYQVDELQAALWRWLPHVRESDGDYSDSAKDACLLIGFEHDEAIQRGELLAQRAEAAESTVEAFRRQMAEDELQRQHLIAELEKAEADAARYRWMRERDVWTTAYGGVKWSMQIRQAPATEGLPFIIANYGTHLDAAIDQTMRGGE